MDEAEQAVLDRIAVEVERVQARIPDLEAKLPDAQAEYDEAWDAWLDDALDHPDDPTPPELEARVDAASRKLMGLFDSITKQRVHIRHLNSPMELARRMQTNERISALRERRPKVAKETAKDQGVPEVYLNADTGNFRIGMDARLKSDLVNAALGIESKEALHEFTKAQAEKLLQKRGWQKFLDRKREIVAAKEKRAAEAAEAKEQRARERAAEKEAKAEAKKKADAEKKAAATDDKKGSSSSSSKGTSKTDQDRAQREAKAAAGS